jgi:hypothetical protein
MERAITPVEVPPEHAALAIPDPSLPIHHPRYIQES